MENGSMERVGRSDKPMFGPKGVIVCGYPPTEQGLFYSFMHKAGFGDRPIVFPSDTDLSRPLKDILAEPTQYGLGASSTLPRALVLSGFTQEELHRVMAAYRGAGLPNQLWATLTPVSENWPLGDLLSELTREAASFKRQDAR